MVTEAPAPLIEVSNGGTFMFKTLKSPTTFQQQASILASRNVIINDFSYCESFLSRVNYYRLTGYLLPFIHNPGNTCSPNVTIEQIEGIYRFDEELRSLLSTVIEKIEIYLRTQLSYYSGHQYGADGYMDASNYNARHNHVVFLGLINRTIQDNSKAPAIHHHIVTYGGKFPIWVIVDYFTLGMLSHFYTDMKNPDKSYLANTLYSVNYQILTSWMRCLTDLRNRCAHYSRLYYWIFPAIPAIPKGDPFRADRTLFSQLYMLKYMYPDPNKWNEDFIKPLAKLLAKYRTYISKSHIGFPYRWKSILKR